MTSWSDLSEAERYIVYKLDRKNFVGEHQVSETGLKNIVRSTTGAEFGIDSGEAMELLDNLQSKNVILQYQSRESYSLNPKFVNKCRDELDEMMSEQSEINRVL